MNCILRKAARLVLVFTGMSLIAPSYAYAYIDPGTGTYVYQILVAILLGGIVAIKQFWSKIINFFKKN